MNFFETELKKMTAKVTLMKNPRLVGRACIARLTDKTTVKTEFATDRVANHYPTIRITVLNRTEGKIDSLTVKFEDLWGKHDGLYVWTAYNDPKWYGYRPTAADYTKTAKAISEYLENFAD
jgi:hypothetical protein